MDCPACGSPVTLEVGPDRPHSISLRDAILAAEADERLEITRVCWDCGWQEERQVHVESIDTTVGDEDAIERATLLNKIADELAAIGTIETLEYALAEIRRYRRLEPHSAERGENTSE